MYHLGRSRAHSTLGTPQLASSQLAFPNRFITLRERCEDVWDRRRCAALQPGQTHAAAATFGGDFTAAVCLIPTCAAVTGSKSLPWRLYNC